MRRILVNLAAFAMLLLVPALTFAQSGSGIARDRTVPLLMGVAVLAGVAGGVIGENV